MTTYTPGPWTLTNSRSGVHSIWAKTIPICHISNPKDKANARLIAAAPDLLKACQSLVDCQNELKGQLPEIVWRAAEYAREAIAKANGKD